MCSREQFLYNNTTSENIDEAKLRYFIYKNDRLAKDRMLCNDIDEDDDVIEEESSDEEEEALPIPSSVTKENKISIADSYNTTHMITSLPKLDNFIDDKTGIRKLDR